jgi:hypothetical protein
MHPAVRAFSERRPRVYGFFMVAVAVALGFVGQRVAAAAVAFLVHLLAAGYGAGGLSYLAFGSQAHIWDARFQERFWPLAKLSWLQACTLITLGLGLLSITGALYWLLR